MKRIIAHFVLSLFTLFGALSAPVQAAKPSGSGSGSGTKASEPIGYDISWPQCGKRLPQDQAFGIVGVNGGLANNTNPCLTEQLIWAKKSSGVTNQNKVQLYLNTANPGAVNPRVSSWPQSSSELNPYDDECTGANDLACSWQYGWNRAQEANVDRFAPAAAAAGIDSTAATYVWWLDVETINTWQSGSHDALDRNVATLEGMASYLDSVGADIGLYSTAYQWGIITGNRISAESNLNGLPNWRPSGSNLNNAKANCSVSPLTNGGFISLTQYVQKNLDHNYSCI